jgi:fructose-1,6-bisphosphatase/inositol monophosphatase family enzyme
MDTLSLLDFAKSLGQEAYSIAQKYYKKNPVTATKVDKSYVSYVTIADEEINQLVIDHVKKQFPSHGVLGEEQSFGLDRQYLWVCDPIDGTLAFTMGQPTFMFSIALVLNGKPIIALTVDLANGDVLHAIKDEGSFLNNTRMYVSQRQLPEARMYFPANIKQMFAYQNFYTTLIDSVSQANPVSGGVFKGCAIAQGLGDGSIWLRYVHPWDMAAIALLITESGGVVTNRHGSADLDYTKDLDGIIMSNSVIHAKLLELVQSTS